MRIRQPLAVLGFSFAGALFFCAWLTIGQMRLFFTAACFLLLPGILLLWKKKGAMLLAVSLMAAIAALLSLYRQNCLWNVLEETSGKEVTLIGTVSEGDINSGWVLRDAKLIWPDGETMATVLVFGDSELLLHGGEKISILASVNSSPPTSSQQGRGTELAVRAVSPSLQILSTRPWWEETRGRILSHLRRGLRWTIADREDAELMIAILTGDDNAVPQRTYGLFQRSGIAHILCVSGLHLSMLAGIFIALFSIIGRRPALLAGLLAMAVFVWLTGWGPSAVRAFIMTALAVGAELLYRDSTPVNALGGAVLVMTVMEPALVCRMGFLLSVTSVLAITAVVPAWTELLNKAFSLDDRPILRGVAGLLLPSFAITLVTIPVMLLFFGYIPLSSPLVNLAVLPLMPFLLCCGLLAGLFSFTPAGIVCHKLLGWIRMVAAIGDKGPILPLGSQILLICILFCFVMAAAVFLLRGKAPSRTAAGVLSLVMICWGSFMAHWSKRDLLTITQYTWKEGSSIILQMGSQAVVVGCGGNSYEGKTLSRLLLAAGVTELSAVVIPTDKLCYTGGAYDFLTAMGAEKVISPDSSRILQALDFADAGIALPLASSTWRLFSEGELTVRAGGKSAVMLLDFGGYRVCLDTSGNPVPYDADFRFLYDKKVAESETTRENYAIMIASGPLVRPSAALYLAGAEEGITETIS